MRTPADPSIKCTYRLGNLIRLLSSDIDGEVLAAVRAIERTLARDGLTLHDLADIVEASGSAGAPETAEWRRAVDELLFQSDLLTDWERRFLETIARYRNPPSTKQLDVLADIWRRLDEDAAHAA